MLASSLVNYIWVCSIGSGPGSCQAQKIVETSYVLVHCSHIEFLKQIWPGLEHGTIYILMPTGLPVENSCLAANPWVTFSSQSPPWLRPSQLLRQLWWESNYANMAERLSTVERKVETLAVEGTGSVQLKGLIKGSSGLATILVDEVHLWRTIKLHVIVRTRCLHSSWPVGKKSPKQTYLQLFTAEVSPSTSACHQRLLLDKIYIGVWPRQTEKETQNSYSFLLLTLPLEALKNPELTAKHKKKRSNY